MWLHSVVVVDSIYGRILMGRHAACWAAQLKGLSDSRVVVDLIKSTQYFLPPVGAGRICMNIAATTARRLFSSRLSTLFPPFARIRLFPIVKTAPITATCSPVTPFALHYRRMATAAHHTDREVLPTDVVPTHYHLSLNPDLETFTYTGNVTVTLDVAKPTSQIVLNAHELELHSASLNTRASGTLEATAIKMDEEKQEVTVEFGEELGGGKGAATLNIAFSGILNDKMAGFYRSSYIDVKMGTKKWLATTQMGMVLS